MITTNVTKTITITFIKSNKHEMNINNEKPFVKLKIMFLVHKQWKEMRK